MSDILIKGMEMPKRCEDCNFYYTDYEEGTATCLATSCYVTPQQYNKGNRDSNCPIVEVPTPHGRLIDTDILRNKLERHRDMCGDVELAHGIDVAIRILNNAPTIIEAEVSEE